MSIDTNTLHDLPLAAADYIDDHGWTQNKMEADDGAVCLTGALRACSPQPEDWNIAAEVARAKSHAENWNDAKGRTAEEVIDWLRTNPITDADLEATFGPQWRQVVALLRRVAVLTEAEVEALDVPRDAAPRDIFAARYATFDAACEAAARDAWDSSRAAVAWAARAARDTAWDAAWDAVRALVVTNLVGQHGLEQHHLDILLAPWRAVFGDPLEATNAD